jgi:hypothetical protein
MADPAKTVDQNILPVQALFNLDNSFNTFIGQGQPFYATVNPSQSGLNITNSTINSSTIGATTPSTGVFTNILSTTGQVTTSPSGNTDIANKLYVDTVAQGLKAKQAVKCATTANITLFGLQTIDTYTTLAGDRVLVKNQTASADNGIYIAASGAWTRSTDMDVWSEVPGAYTIALNGSANLDTGWVCTAADTGTIGVTAMPWVQFSGSATYYAGTGLTLASNTFSITNTGVTAASYGSASSVPVLAINAQGQVTSASSSSISIANTQVSGLGTMSTQNANNVSISGGSITGTPISGSTVGGTTITASTQFSGPATGLTGTAASLSIGGNAATATSATTANSATTATTATNLAGGAAGSVPYQSASGATSMLAVGSNGQVLTLNSGVPSWATPTTGTVTSVSGTGTVSGISLSGTVTSSGSLTLGGTLDLSAPPIIGGTTPNAITGTTITANTKFVSQDYYAQSILGGNLRTSSGTSLLNWDGGGSGNVTVNGGLLVNPANKNVSLAPTGTGTVTINPATASAMDNMAIGGTTPLAGTFTTLRFNTSLSVNGSTGSSGQVLTSSGSGLPTWTTPTAYATVTDDTTTNATRYPLFAAATSGNLTTEYTSSTKYQFNPSTGALTAGSMIANKTITGSNNTGAFSYGTLSYSDVDIFASSSLSVNNYVQSIQQNTNNGTAASADYIVSNDSGTATTYYGDFGITSSGFNSPSTNITNTPNTVYLQSVTTGLAIGTLNSFALTFYTNSTQNAQISSSGVWSFTNTITGSISGNAGTATTATTATNATNVGITDDTTTNATVYPIWVTSTTGNLPEKTSSTKLKFNPSTGALTASQLIIAP